MKYILSIFIFLVFNASWQWWALMCAFMLFEIYAFCTTFWKEYKRQKKEMLVKKQMISPDGKVMTKEDLEAIWNNGYAVGVEHSQIRKH